MNQGQAIVLKDVVVVRSGFPILAGLSLNVKRGEAVVLRGPNGSGKTTLLELVSGLTRPTSGVVEVLGQDLATASSKDLRTIRSSLGYVSYDLMASGELTVIENMSLFRLLRSDHGSFSIEDLIAEFGLSRIAKLSVRSLSAGQRRRLGLAIGFDAAKELLLLDEPYVGLDENGSRMLDGMINHFVSTGGTVLMASHVQTVDHHIDGMRDVYVCGGRVNQAESIDDRASYA